MFYLIEKWSQYLLINHHLTECKLKVCITQKVLEAKNLGLEISVFYLIEKWSQYLLINHHLTECKLKVCITQKILEAMFEQKYFIKPNSFLSCRGGGC